LCKVFGVEAGMLVRCKLCGIHGGVLMPTCNKEFQTNIVSHLDEEFQITNKVSSPAQAKKLIIDLEIAY